MKYISIDIETSGIDPNTHQILEFAAVIEDTENMDVPIEDLPYFHKIIYHENIIGSPYALNLNKNLIERISKESEMYIPNYGYNDFVNSGISKQKIMTELKYIGYDFNEFLKLHQCESYESCPSNKITIAGKNFRGFDLQFLNQIKDFPVSVFHHRSLDPSILYFNPLIDNELPSLTECCIRGDIDQIGEEHTALGNARTIIAVLRSYFTENILIYDINSSKL